MSEQNQLHYLQSRNVREAAEEEKWSKIECVWGEERQWIAYIKHKEVCGEEAGMRISKIYVN